MATTTTNFGWDIPQSTDLVKDGATAIAALGQDIDTAFVDFKGGTTGQVLKKSSATDLDVEWGTPSSGLTLINTTSFSAVASQAVDDIFSSTYNNYVIAVNITGVGSGDVTLRLNYRTTGGVDVTTNLGTQRISFYTSVAGSTIANATFGASGSSNPTFSNYVLNVANPNLARRTTYISTGGYVNNSAQPFIDLLYGHHTGNDIFTGIKIFPSASTFSGSISIYGVNK
jgi:hypothetical protein